MTMWLLYELFCFIYHLCLSDTLYESLLQHLYGRGWLIDENDVHKKAIGSNG